MRARVLSRLLEKGGKSGGRHVIFRYVCTTFKISPLVGSIRLAEYSARRCTSVSRVETTFDETFIQALCIQMDATDVRAENVPVLLIVPQTAHAHTLQLARHASEKGERERRRQEKWGMRGGKDGGARRGRREEEE